MVSYKTLSGLARLKAYQAAPSADDYSGLSAICTLDAPNYSLRTDLILGIRVVPPTTTAFSMSSLVKLA